MRFQIRIRHILAGLALGLLLGFLMREYVSSQSRIVVTGTVPVVVAEVNLPAGSVLKPKVVRVVQWPRQVPPAQAAESLQQVAGRLVLSPVVKGEPILLNKLAPLVHPEGSLKTEGKMQVISKMLYYPSRFIEDSLDLVDKIHEFYNICTFPKTPVDSSRTSISRSSVKLPPSLTALDQIRREGRHISIEK